MKFQKKWLYLSIVFIAVKTQACCYFSCDPQVSKAFSKIDSYLNTTYTNLEKELKTYENNVNDDLKLTSDEVNELNKLLTRAKIYLLKNKQITFNLSKYQKSIALNILKQKDN
ncbi:hypothetical protein [Caminibacter pacificus]|uniref:Uncharacterized protein n=1 Tax=Caminibacter pacificus TaxID=1424653 RepID=A0AAJ4RAP9_9BACT|nr:hypothetical protein [Caminibacter pacificus]QDD68149.1 hypothetical protein C6V80_09860 [Caminibacter pacificus]ROR38767.1 hypothetical protein EDC58_1982 [Caminibacter pacificus]